MRRPTATVLLLVVAAAARATAIALAVPPGEVDLRLLVLAVDVLVPAALAAGDLRRTPAAASGTLAYGALGAGTLVTFGLALLGGDVTVVTGPLLALLVGATAAMLAGAAIVGRWQDAAAPRPGPGPRALRGVAVAGGLALGAVLVTEDVAVLGLVPVGAGALPGPVGIATTIDLARIPLLLAVLLPVAWATTRTDVRHLVAVALVLGARALVETVADTALLSLAAPRWPSVVGALATVVLLGVVPVWGRRTGQATSSSA